MRRGKTRAAVAAAVIAALGIGTAGALAASAGAASSPSPAAPVAAPLTTAHVSFSVSVRGLTSAALTIAGTAQVDFTDDALALTATLPPAVAQLLPGGTSAPEIVHAVFSGDTVYVDIPGLASLVGEPWISVALPATLSSGVPRVFTQVASALGDVKEIIQFARAHHATVSSLGTATVDGVTATGTRIVATLSAPKHPRTLAAAVWADASGRLVQGTLTVSGAGPPSTSGLTAVVNVTDDGAPVTITVPPPAQVKAIPFSTVIRILKMLLHHGHHGGHDLGAHPALAS